MSTPETPRPMIDLRGVSKWYGPFQVLNGCTTRVAGIRFRMAGGISEINLPSGELSAALSSMSTNTNGMSRVRSELCSRLHGPHQSAP